MNFNMIKTVCTFALMLLYLNGFNLPQIQAEEKHHHKAHVHGVAQLNVVLEDNELYIEFISPAANIVGFEHQPKTEKQKDAVKNAIKALKAGEELFALSRKAGTKLTTSKVVTDLEIEHGHEHEHVHKDEHEEHHSEEATHHEEHHEEHAHEAHSDFMAVYRFESKNPNQLTHMDVMLFQHFAGIETIDVQILTRTKVSAFELTAKKNRINF